MDATVFATTWAAALYTAHILAYAVDIAVTPMVFPFIYGSLALVCGVLMVVLWSIAVGLRTRESATTTARPSSSTRVLHISVSCVRARFGRAVGDQVWLLLRYVTSSASGVGIAIGIYI